MSASNRAKELGAKNLKEVADAISKHVTTLHNWYNDNPILFEMVVIGYVSMSKPENHKAIKDLVNDSGLV